MGGAPPVPGLPKAPAPPGSAPPIPGHNRARSNSEQVGGNAAAAVPDSAPPLAGLFAGGMPKLKKRGGGVDTGGTFDPRSFIHEFLLTVLSTP